LIRDLYGLGFPKPLSAKYSLKDANLLEVDATLAQIDVEFDSDLYISRSINCPSFDCSSQDAIQNASCFCNYASKENCGTAPPECNITCGIHILYARDGFFGVAISSTPMITAQDLTWCSQTIYGDTDWVELNGSQLALNLGLLPLRIHVDSKCSAFYIDMLYRQKQTTSVFLILLENTGIFYYNSGDFPFLLNNPYLSCSSSSC
jgi:hypothetical protein